MKKMKTNWFIGMIALMIPLMILSSCSTKQNIWGSKNSGLNLTYRFEEMTELKYEIINDFTQVMEVMDQPMEIKSYDMLRFSIWPTPSEGDLHKMKVEVNEMSIKITTPRGEIEPDLSSVIGKSFHMDFGIRGKESNLAEAENITYTLTTGQESNLGAKFQAIFPDMPERPMKVGDVWITNDTIVDKSSNGEIMLAFEGKNRIVSFEKWNEIECIKIVTFYEGTITGKSTEQGMEMITDGTLSGTDTWYFAYKEGYYVKGTNEGKMHGKVTASGPQEMVIPLSRDFTMITSMY